METKLNTTATLPLKFYDYSDAELMAVIEHLYDSMHTLACTLDNSRPDVATILDSIIDHPTSITELDDVKTIPNAVIIDGVAVVSLDRMAHRFFMMDMNGTVLDSVPAMDDAATAKKVQKIANRRTR